MPALNWDSFEKLPGATEYNFETLCRALIRRHYGRYGDFAALAAQPGVEFHLPLHTQCSLGEPGRWYGWQCRWYDLPGGKALGTTRRKKIEQAIATTEQELPRLTDWVLWTRRPLTKGDQKWFKELSTHMRLHLWTSADVEEHLSGDAEIFRGTYFGELVLTADSMANLHAVAVAPIRRRWQPEVHQVIAVERALRRMLGELSSWDDLHMLAVQLEADAASVDTDRKNLTGSLADATAEVAGLARSVADALADTHSTMDRGDLDLLWQQLNSRPVQPTPKLAVLPRQLRSRRHAASLSVTNALADVNLALSVLDKVDVQLRTRLIAVVADAGCGKTELAAQLTVAVRDRPAGILLHGRDLHAGHSLDNLAGCVSIQGNPVRSMEALLAAVDAAGQRTHRRIPIVIDGLNEAEDPRDWKGALAALDVTLRHYPYVLVACTLRTAFASETLPSEIPRHEIPDFQHDTMEAIRRYFSYYKINGADAELPMGLLRHPLTLRLFCEVTNPTRQRVVGIEAMPGSLTGLFDRYLEQVTERIAELAPRTRRYYEQDVRTALDKIGATLWENKARSLDLAELRHRLGDDGRPWNESIVRALEQDGVLIRVPGDTPAATNYMVAYDALAGHLIADAVMSRQGRTGLEKWVKDPVNVTALTASLPHQHPLGSDLFRGLVGLVPRRLHRQQLWPMLDEPLRTEALHGTADLEGTYLDSQTVDELAMLVSQSATRQRDLLDRLRYTRGAPNHPLNAAFLERVLRPMSVADRDLRWTEWLRSRRDNLLADLRHLEKRWRSAPKRSEADQLRARWVMWTLTSTVRELRDQATRTLYWFGRGEPAALFELTLDALAINDAYVSERLLASSYGVTMAHQLPDPQFSSALAVYLTGLRDSVTGPTAIYPTNHWLARLHIQGTVTLARTYYRAAIPETLHGEGCITFAPGPGIEPIPRNDPRASEVDATLHMDFENYTLGRLFDNRRNYDMTHPGHQAAVAHVLGTVWAHGWRASSLGAVDAKLMSDHGRADQALTDRYGKKYGWIGFHTFTGMLDNAGLLPTRDERLSDVHIDPSFPEPSVAAPIALPMWASRVPIDDQAWIQGGVIAIPDELLYRQAIGDQPGPWLAVHADLETRGQAPGRRVFGILTALLVDPADAERLVRALNMRQHPGMLGLPEIPSDHYTFAGEIPWSPEFASGSAADDPTERYRQAVEVGNGRAIATELVAHRYAWESYHSPLNEARGALVPSRPFSAAFDLRGMPQSFGQAMPDGTAAAMSFGAPSAFEGNILYLRQDLVHRYAAGRRLIWFAWGERQLYPYSREIPDWLIKAQRSDQHVWRHIRKGEDLSSVLTVKTKATGLRKR